MSRVALIAVGAAAGVAVWLYQTSQQDAPQDSTQDAPEAENAPGVMEQAGYFIKIGWDAIMPYSVSVNLAKNRPYVEAALRAEVKYGIPSGLLVAQLYQESRFNPQAVNSNSGAQGIAQFMPATAAQFSLDPFDAYAAIDAAGRYMAQLYKSTGDWKLALGAYNWGIGNVTRKGIAKAPLETRNYMAQITTNAGYA